MRTPRSLYYAPPGVHPLYPRGGPGYLSAEASFNRAAAFRRRGRTDPRAYNGMRARYNWRRLRMASRLSSVFRRGLIRHRAFNRQMEQERRRMIRFRRSMFRGRNRR